MTRYRTSRIVVRCGGKHKAFYQVTLGNMRHAKAVYNTTLFYIRNLFTGLHKEEKLRTENEKTVIEGVNAALAQINEKRLGKGKPAFSYPSAEAPWLSDYLWLSVMNRILKSSLPRPVTFYSKLEQTTVISACRAMKSFRTASADYAKDPKKYLGRPHLPRYHKEETFTLDYDCQMVSCEGSGRKHTLRLAAVQPRLKTGKKYYEHIVSVRLSYSHGEILAHVCVKEEVPETDALQCAHTTADPASAQRSLDRAAEAFLDPRRVLGIDPGVKNFLTVCPGYGKAPFIIRGGRLKAVNQYYNKQKAAQQSRLKKEYDRYTSHRLDQLEMSREHYLYNFFHQASGLIVNYALADRAGTIVIGRNTGWKQEVKLGSVNTQKFVYIPFRRFFRILEDKARMAGIRVVFTEESYTSLACSLTRDPLPAYQPSQKPDLSAFGGTRVQRGLYRCSDGRTLNADVNGAANIIRKYSEEALQEDLSYLTGEVSVMKVA